MRSCRISVVSCFVITIILAASAPIKAAPMEEDRCLTAKKIYDRGTKLMNYEARRAAFQKAVDLCPSYAEAHVNLADALENMGRRGDQYSEKGLTTNNKFLDKAVEHYKKAIELNSELFPAYFGLAEVYAETGRYELAKDACRNALRLRSQDETAKEILAKIEKRISEETGGIKKDGQIKQTVKDSRLDEDFNAMGIEDYTLKDRQSFNNILFDGWSARISSGETAQLNEIGKALSSPDLASFRFVVEGHTNIVGGYEENERLSWDRAKSVKEYLMKTYKIDPNRLLTQGFGYTRLKYEDRPKDEKNRRVEILFLKQAESQ